MLTPAKYGVGPGRYTKLARSSADSLRMIWNAGGPLPAAQAVQMRDMYSTNAKRCVIMPSYGRARIVRVRLVANAPSPTNRHGAVLFRATPVARLSACGTMQA